MRVPIPLVILLALAVISGTWWGNTRHLDFVKPPSEARLAQVRERVQASLLPVAEPAREPETIFTQEQPLTLPLTEPTKPPMDLGDLTTPLTLQSYGELSPKGAAYLAELATALEENAQSARALLAWERILDLAKASDAQQEAAISSIKRLRPQLPPWNEKPESASVLMLNATTGKRFASVLPAVLEGIARDIEAASSGTVRIQTRLSISKIPTTPQAPCTIDLSLSGTAKKPRTTDTLSFTTDKPEALRPELFKIAFQLVRGQLARTTAYTPPSFVTAGGNPQSALNFHITRLCWSEFAAGLNALEKKAP